MSAFLKDLYFFGRNYTNLVRSKMPHKDRIVYDYFRISAKAAIHRLLKTRMASERIAGFTIHAFDYDAISFLFGEIFLRGEYLFASKSPSPVILDCGANIGMASLFFKWLYPQSVVYAFEPDKNTFLMLQKNIE